MFGYYHQDNPHDTGQSNNNGNCKLGTNIHDYETRKISTLMVCMPASALCIGQEMKRFLAILMLRHKSINIHPHTKGLANVIKDYAMFPVDDTSSKYIYNIKKKTYTHERPLPRFSNERSQIHVYSLNILPCRCMCTIWS